ncbi:tetratricopeptide repeat protein [Crocinitomix algicola]|uniref:tetratricopeptide repeat protein n=1 Tax=Crocinitomix algicola TaxID=1740263 RepID=UPI000837A1B3|nr:tetratricopeptide repeat protein [Crocinitomix algicola]
MAKKNRESQIEEVEALTSTENFIDKYKNAIMIGGGAIVVVVLGIIGYQKLVAEPNEIASQEAYWPAFYEFEKDSMQLAANGNEMFDGMLDVADEYSGTSGGNIANYTLAIGAMKAGNFEEAIEYLDECDFDDVMMGSLVLGLKGDCYVELDQNEDAVNYFEKAAAREQNDYTSPMYLKKAGLTYEALNQPEDALNAYLKIKNDWPESEEATDIDKYIARVEN